MPPARSGWRACTPARTSIRTPPQRSPAPASAGPRGPGQLARAHLIQPAGPGRYGLHDLLRAYARELAALGRRGGAAGGADPAVRPLPAHGRARRWTPCTPPNAIAGPASPRRPTPSRRWPTRRGTGVAGRRTGHLVAVGRLYRRARLARLRHQPGRHLVPLPRAGRPLPRGHDDPQPRPRRGPADRRPGRRGDRAEPPGRRRLAAEPLPAGRQLPPEGLGFVPASRRPRRAGPARWATSAKFTTVWAATGRPSVFTGRP